jgi:hypothetical protein
MTTTREQIFAALFALGQNIAWTDPVSGEVGGWSVTRRRISTPDQIGADDQPALLQAEANEQFIQVTRMPSKRTFSAAWVIYLRSYDAPAPTGPLLNAVMDAVEAAFAPDDLSGEACTLGGLVTHCWIDGTVFKDPGDLDQQAMLVVPIKLLVP